MRRRIRRLYRLEDGFSMITVLVAIAFIGIMAMMVLSISAINFRMKATNIKGQSSFYIAEKALNDIKAGLQSDVGDAMSNAYVKVLENYNVTDNTAGESLDGQRQKKFKQYFIETLEEDLKGLQVNTYNMNKIRGYVDLLEEINNDPNSEGELKIVNTENRAPVMTVIKDEKIVLKNLKVLHIDSTGHTSIIETDIALSVPEVTFPTPSTLPDVMNMIVVANQGVFCVDGLAGSDKGISIKGNVYAGSQFVVEPHTNVSFTNGERVVTSGKVNIGNNASFKTSYQMALWAEGIDVSSATVELNGATYIADDLTVERGTNIGSNITINGEYYGFGSEQSAKESYFHQVGLKYNDNNTVDTNSSIIINGRNTTIDLSNVDRFMIGGNSYISKPVSTGSNDDGLLTGESLNIKGTQLAYLMPASVIGDGTGKNPMTFSEYQNTLKNGVLPVDLTQPIAEWDGKTLSDFGLDKTNPYSIVTYPIGNGEGFVYVYLNFKTGNDASKFFDWYYNENEDRKKQIDQYLNFYLSNDGVKIKNKDAFLRFVTNGNVFGYSKGKGSLLTPNEDELDQDLLYEQINYQNTWYSLTRKMIPNFDMLSEEEKKPERQVFENLIIDSMFEEMTNNGTGSMEFQTVDEKQQPIKAIVVKNNSEFVITKEVAEELRLLICTGDVRIEKDVDFQGIIMTKGTLTIENGATLTSTPVEASLLLQASSEDKKLALLFYDGEQYAIGNSTGNSNQTGESTTYQLEDCITYENWKKR